MYRVAPFEQIKMYVCMYVCMYVVILLLLLAAAAIVVLFYTLGKYIPEGFEKNEKITNR